MVLLLDSREQAHECTFATLSAEHLGDVRHDARLVLLNDDDQKVFTGKVNLNAATRAMRHLPLPSDSHRDGHYLNSGILQRGCPRCSDANIGLGSHGVNEAGTDRARRTETNCGCGCQCTKAHDAAEQCARRAVAVVLGERAVQGEIHLLSGGAIIWRARYAITVAPAAVS